MEGSKIIYPIAGFAKGHYSCVCTDCKSEFTGDKRSTQCEVCAINFVNADRKKLAVRVFELERSIKAVFDNTIKLRELL